MARGRKTGGRQRGTPNRVTAAREAEIAAAGLTPLDYMLSILRDETADPKDRMWAAEKAAPFVHPRLATVEHQGGFSVTNPAITDEQREAALEEYFASRFGAQIKRAA